ncbi:MAG: phage baseplate upper protein [Clostridiales bacterium]|jgi:hypothetical protein|nr:phage baseplate upper protein [Clostridiales bacterium]
MGFERQRGVAIYKDRPHPVVTGYYVTLGDANAHTLKIALKDGSQKNHIFKIPENASVYISFRAPGRRTVKGKSAIVTNRENGEVTYSLAIDEIASAGQYEAFVKVCDAVRSVSFQPFIFGVKASAFQPFDALPEKYDATVDELISKAAELSSRVAALEESGFLGAAGEKGDKGDKGEKGDNGAAVAYAGGAARRYAHLSVDDAELCLNDVRSALYSSVFQNDFFGGLKQLHDEYGAVFSLYCYLDSVVGLPARYSEELSQNSDWLKFGLHSKNASHSFLSETPETAKLMYDSFVSAIVVFAGSCDSVDRAPRLHMFEGNLAVMTAMRDCHCGLLGALAPEKSNPDPDSGDRTAYYLDYARKQWLKDHAKLIDVKNGLLFFTTTLRSDWLESTSDWSAVYAESGGDAGALLTAWLSDPSMADSMSAIEAFGHEWKSGILEQFRKICEFAVARGYRFSFAQNEYDFGIASTHLDFA